MWEGRWLFDFEETSLTCELVLPSSITTPARVTSESRSFAIYPPLTSIEWRGSLKSFQFLPVWRWPRALLPQLAASIVMTPQQRWVCRSATVRGDERSQRLPGSPNPCSENHFHMAEYDWWSYNVSETLWRYFSLLREQIWIWVPLCMEQTTTTTTTNRV